jgi:hypothetical protein
VIDGLPNLLLAASRHDSYLWAGALRWLPFDSHFKTHQGVNHVQGI